MLPMGSSETQKPKCTLRENLWRRWLVLWPATIVLAVYPISNVVLRVAMVCCILLLWVGSVGFFWQVKSLRFGLMTVAALVLICFALPGKLIDRKSLREAYVGSLRKYEGTRYVWGGENRVGIDCSGLVRAGLINAETSEAFRTRNPKLLRNGVALWWNDCSARALSEGFRQYTFPLFDSKSLDEVNLAQLQPGDLAVTDDGIHVLAYLGNESWIEADPVEKRVLVIGAHTTNAWSDLPVKLIRWRQLQTPDAPEINAVAN
jgi:hypothetical protein